VSVATSSRGSSSRSADAGFSPLLARDPTCIRVGSLPARSDSVTRVSEVLARAELEGVAVLLEIRR
jgi:hypothetical protein